MVKSLTDFNEKKTYINEPSISGSWYEKAFRLIFM